MIEQEWHIQTSPYLYLVGADCLLIRESTVVYLMWTHQWWNAQKNNGLRSDIGDQQEKS
jgi:hypothetical protein